MKEVRGAICPGKIRSGFTLIELLVVIAIIALLAAVLLPSLVRAKDSAKSAACKNNLRQLGFALNLYVTDYEKYPGNAAMYERVGIFGELAFRGIWAAGMNWLHPYLGGKYDPDDINSQHHWHDAPEVLRCPGRKPLKSIFGSRDVHRLGYGYNEVGSGWPDGQLSLGLGFKVELTGFDGASGQPLGFRTFRSPQHVISPASMIAIADTGEGAGWLTPNYPIGLRSTLVGPHANSLAANVLFADGHVEFGKHEKWNAPVDEARARWNNDNLPHPETWR